MSEPIVVTPQLIIEMMLKQFDALDDAQRMLEKALNGEPDAERTYREARAECWPSVQGTATEKEDMVNAMTADQRRARDMAQSFSKAMMEKVRNERQKLSALQSAANAIREEAALARVGPEMGANR